MSKEILNKENVLTAIYKKYDSLNLCSEALGISINNLSNKLRRLTPKFLAQLQSIGVEIKDNDLSVKELKELVEKTNFEIERLKAKLYDITGRLDDLTK